MHHGHNQLSEQNNLSRLLEQFPVVELLKRLSTGESLPSVKSAMGLSETDLLRCFQIASDIMIEIAELNPSPRGIDWRQMSIADALTILSKQTRAVRS